MRSVGGPESEASVVEEAGPGTDAPTIVTPIAWAPVAIHAGFPMGPGPYQYEPLEAGSLRLILLLEADDLEDDLECAILHKPLLSKPEYTALSYVWGTERDNCAIYVGDKYLSIGTNLDTALRYLRRKDRSLCLWVDALCINQSNVEERNHHVHQMRRIYEASTDTVVYLGDQTGDNTGISAWNFLERNSTWAFNENKEKTTTGHP